MGADLTVVGPDPGMSHGLTGRPFAASSLWRATA
jgi:hypothetical protein